MVTPRPHQVEPGVTNDDHNFATDGEVIRHWALKLYEAEGEHIRGGTIFALLGPIGVLQRYGVTQAQMETVIRAASRRLPFPFDLFEGEKAA